MTGIGHNTGGDQLKLLLERVENLEAEKQALADDVKDVYAEAKARGFDAKAMRQLVRLRKQKPEDRKAQALLLQTYAEAIGLDLI